MLVMDSAVDFFQAETAGYIGIVMEDISGEYLNGGNYMLMTHLHPGHDSAYIGKDTQMITNAYRAISKEEMFLSINVHNDLFLN
jgi:hypothetical protein